jgi:hypothetical protein
MIKKIYLDMDGVLCNFERRYLELYDELPGSMRDRKDFNVNWDHFVQSEQFKTLDWWPGGRDRRPSRVLEHQRRQPIPFPYRGTEVNRPVAGLDRECRGEGTFQ